MKNSLIAYPLVLLMLVVTSSTQSAVTISIAESGHATVPIRLEGVGVRQFVLDTGAEGSAVYQGFNDAAGLQPTKDTSTLVGQTGAEVVSLVKLPSLTFDGTRMEGIDAVVMPARADGVSLNGIVGLDVFGQALLDFDLPGMRVALQPSGTLISTARPSEVIVAKATSGELLTVPVRLNGVEAVAVIDTGARKTRINWKLGNKLGLHASRIAAGDVIQGATNNPLQAGRAMIAEVELGRRVLKNIAVQVVDLPVFEHFGVAGQPAVILGLDWLTETRMIIDFPRRHVWFIDSAR